MGQVFKAAFKCSFGYRFIPFAEQEHGMLQSFFLQPFAWSTAELFLKIPFKCREAAAAQYGILLHFQVKAVIVVHYPFK